MKRRLGSGLATVSATLMPQPHTAALAPHRCVTAALARPPQLRHSCTRPPTGARQLCSLTSHRCATMGASAQECSAFMPIFPFLKTMNVKDLSNHLREKERFTGLNYFKKTESKCKSPTPFIWVRLLCPQPPKGWPTLLNLCRVLGGAHRT